MRKVKNFIVGFFVLFPFLGYLFCAFSNGYSSETSPTNFITMIGAGNIFFEDFLCNIFPKLGSFTIPFLSKIFGSEGVLFLLTDSSINTVGWLLDYYILLPFLYLIVELFTFIPKMLIKFLDRLKRENEK